jgi:DNA polymerase-3 subunit delta'
LAYRLARFLLSPQEAAGGLFGDALPPESLRVGPEKETFKRIAAGSHSDLLVLDAEDIKVEQAREVPAFLSMTPAESDWRVVIIDSADAMNRNAANALLKTLEEPPAKAVIILISHNPGALLPTIRSRCRMLRLNPLIEKHFVTILTSILPDITSEQHHALAVLSGGSVGDALFFHENDAVSLYRDILELASQCETSALHSFAERLNRKEASSLFQTFARVFICLQTRMASINSAHMLEVFAGERELLHTIYAAKKPDEWMEFWDKSNQLLRDTENLYLDKKQSVISLLRFMS